MLPNWGQMKLIMQNRIEGGGTITGITVQGVGMNGIYWTSNFGFSGWNNPVGLTSPAGWSSYLESTGLNVRCIR